MSCGIYKIQNLINHKIYIGQSVNIEKRLSVHKSSKDNCYIHNAIQKYGIMNFDFSIVESCPKQELDEKEIYYIKKYNSLIPNGYNMTPGADKNTSYITQIPVIQYSLKGKKLAQYQSMSQAQRQTGIKTTHISQCCLGQIKQAGGYKWRKKNNNTIPIRKDLKKHISVLQYSLEGKFIKQYQTIVQAGKAINRNASCVSNACLGRTKTCAGFQWRYRNFNEKRIRKNIQPLKKNN